MNNYYNINYARIGVLLLPTFLRKSLMVAFIKALMKPLDEIQRNFTTYQEALDTNTYSQVCYMQGVLNNNFDPLERRIRIKQALLDESSYLWWLRIKTEPIRLCKRNTAEFVPRLMNRKGFIGTSNPDFIIELPVGYVLSESEEVRLRAFVNQNKLASKQYIITNG